MALVLVFALSLRLRQREIGILFKIGGSRLTIARLLAAEVLIIGLTSALLSAVATVMVHRYSGELVRGLFIQ